MSILKEEGSALTKVKEGVQRRLIHGESLMTVVIDFNNGPWEAPDPPHHHIHEQTTYIAEGEIIFFCEGHVSQKLTKGDMFYVPSGKEHTIQLLTRTVRLVDSFTPLRQDFL